MKRVVLLGDSIRLIGYGTKVPELLGDGYEVWQSEDNGRFAQYTLRMLFDFREQIEGADVIHWNNGHWDLCELFGDGSFTPLPMYVETMVRMARLLRQYGKKVIFATTTPAAPGNPYNRNEVIRKFNEAIVPALKAEGVEINDLYGLVSPDIGRYICEDRLHLSAEGIDLCAEAVARRIKNAADSL